MKLKFKGENCFEGRTYGIAADCTIVEVYICTNGRETYQYFVKHPKNDATLLFSFGIPVDLSQPEPKRFSRYDLLKLYNSGYFDDQIVKLEKEIEEEL